MDYFNLLKQLSDYLFQLSSLDDLSDRLFRFLYKRPIEDDYLSIVANRKCNFDILWGLKSEDNSKNYRICACDSINLRDTILEQDTVNYLQIQYQLYPFIKFSNAIRIITYLYTVKIDEIPLLMRYADNPIVNKFILYRIGSDTSDLESKVDIINKENSSLHCTSLSSVKFDSYEYFYPAPDRSKYIFLPTTKPLCIKNHDNLLIPKPGSGFYRIPTSFFSNRS